MENYKQLVIVSFKYDGKNCMLPRILHLGNKVKSLEQAEVIRLLVGGLKNYPGVDDVKAYTNLKGFENDLRTRFEQIVPKSNNGSVKYLTFERQVFEETQNYDYSNDPFYVPGIAFGQVLPVRVMDWNYGYALDDISFPVIITADYVESLNGFDFIKI